MVASSQALTELHTWARTLTPLNISPLAMKKHETLGEHKRGQCATQGLMEDATMNLTLPTSLESPTMITIDNGL